MVISDKKTADLAYREPGSDTWRELKPKDDSKEEQVNAHNAKDKLKNALLASLQMQHLVVLAGSGCSLSAGGPSMANLWDAVVGKEPKQEAKQVVTKVHHDPADKNIEALLSKIDAFLQVGQDKAVSMFLNESKQIILDQCSAFLEPEKLDDHRTFLHRLSRRGARAPRLKVFTTNYDLCFERAAAALGSVVLDGFSFTAPRQYDPRFFGYDIVQRPAGGNELGSYVAGVFQLHKLHGSVNWARGENGTIHEKDTPNPEETCLIYPARGKYQQSFTQPYLESIAQYLAAVREPNTCLLTVGFGFNDDHLTEPLLTAIETNPHLRVIVADPGARALELNGHPHWKRLHELSNSGEDVWFINAPFGGFAQMIPDLKSLTPADTLMKAIKGVVRES